MKRTLKLAVLAAVFFAAAAPAYSQQALSGDIKQQIKEVQDAISAIAFMVYEDFMHYKTGIYTYATGKRLGGHAVLLVGYNDAEKYFPVKNSWDLGWGEHGFFRIAYSEMDNSVNFGLSTIAYRADKDEVPVGEIARAGAWSRVAPLFESASSWK